MTEDTGPCKSPGGGAALPYMPLWVGDYLADTRHLTTVEHGAYLLLILEYWRKGSLPSSDERLARIAAMREADWLKIKCTIAEFFTSDWRHDRIDRELAKAHLKSVAAKASATARWGKSRSRRDSGHASEAPDAMRGSHGDRISCGMLSESNSYPSLPSVEMEAPKAPKRSHRRSRIDPDRGPDASDIRAAVNAGLSTHDCELEWAHFVDYHLSKGTLSADWSASWRTWLANVRKGTFARGAANGREGNFTRATRELLAECEPSNLQTLPDGRHPILDLAPLPTEQSDHLVH